MKLCIDALFPLLALPPPSAAATLLSLASAIAVVAVAILVVLLLAAAVHRVHVPLLSFLASARRRAWWVTPLALALATVDPKEVHVATLHLQLRLRPLLRLPHRHEHDAVALHVPNTSFIPHLILRRIIVLIDSGGSARTLPPKPHHLPLAPEEPIQWAHILSLHLQRRDIPSNDASAALTVILAHDFF